MTGRVRRGESSIDVEEVGALRRRAGAFARCEFGQLLGTFDAGGDCAFGEACGEEFARSYVGGFAHDCAVGAGGDGEPSFQNAVGADGFERALGCGELSDVANKTRGHGANEVALAAAQLLSEASEDGGGFGALDARGVMGDVLLGL